MVLQQVSAPVGRRAWPGVSGLSACAYCVSQQWRETASQNRFGNERCPLQCAGGACKLLKDERDFFFFNHVSSVSLTLNSLTPGTLSLGCFRLWVPFLKHFKEHGCDS